MTLLIAKQVKSLKGQNREVGHITVSEVAEQYKKQLTILIVRTEG